MWILCLLVIFAFFSALYITRLAIIIHMVNTSRGNVLHSSKKRKTPIKTLAVVGSGGHTTEIMRLMGSLSQSYTPRYYVLANTDKMSEEKIHKLEKSRSETQSQMIKKRSEQYKLWRIPRSREVKQSWISTVFSTLYASVFSFPLVFRIRPDLVLCNGPGTCIPVCLAALLMSVIGIKKVTIVYVESFCRVETLSLSGKILYYLADQFIVQWPELREKYPRSTYIGRVV